MFHEPGGPRCSHSDGITMVRATTSLQGLDAEGGSANLLVIDFDKVKKDTLIDLPCFWIVIKHDYWPSCPLKIMDSANSGSYDESRIKWRI